MNDNDIIRNIQIIVGDWHLEDWKRFRALNDYWGAKDIYFKEYYDSKRKKWNYGVYSAWLRWKLDMLIEYVK